jgi:hypothetical protein
MIRILRSQKTCFVKHVCLDAPQTQQILFIFSIYRKVWSEYLKGRSNFVDLGVDEWILMLWDACPSGSGYE